jgi:5S rRNA maturation endonuclease (ribonuclease M5)
VLRSLVVVEGTSDVAALRRAVDCPVAVTNGTPQKAGSRELYRLPPGALLRDLASERDVIIFADPDSAGALGCWAHALLC